MKKRIFGILLTLCMVLALFPVAVFAVNNVDYTLSGIEDGQTYCGPQTVTIYCTGNELSILKVNGISILEQYPKETSLYEFTLEPQSGPQTIEMLQFRGLNATITVTVNDGHTLTHHEAAAPTTENNGNIAFWQCQNCNACFSDENGENEISPESTVLPKLYTFTANFSVAVTLSGNTAPDTATFTLEPLYTINAWENITVTGGTATVNGTTPGNGSITFTGSIDDLRACFAEGMYFRQKNEGLENWVYDDTVWALWLEEDGVSLLSDNADAFSYTMRIYPTAYEEFDDSERYYYTDLEKGSVSGMTFNNTYTKNVHIHNYVQKFNNTHHWDICDCEDVQNRGLHKFGEWKVTLEATETTEGKQSRTCTLCDYVEEAVIPALTPTTPTPSPAPTPSTTPGHTHAYTMKHDKAQHWKVCDCGDIQDREDHKFGTWTVTKKATETATGEKVRVCSVCGYSETLEVSKLTKQGSPDTGDYFSSLLWLGLFAVSVAGVAGCGIYRRKRL